MFDMKLFRKFKLEQTFFLKKFIEMLQMKR